MGVVFGKRRDPDVHRAHVRERLRLEILHKAQQFAQTRDERSQRVLDACSGAAEHIFPYAAVHMELRPYATTHEQFGSSFIWITVDNKTVDEATASELPPGVRVDFEGHVFVPSYKCYPDRHISNEDLKVAFVPPVKPLPPTAAKCTSAAITVKWLATTSLIDKFELQSYPLQPGGYGTQIWRTVGNAIPVTSFTLSDLPCAFPFKFRVRSHSPHGWSPFSDESQPVYTLPDVPVAVDPPVVTVQTDGDVVCEWKMPEYDNGSAVIRFTVQARKSGAATKFETMFTGMALMCQLKDLEAGTVYHLRVAAWNDVGAGPYSECSIATTPEQNAFLGDKLPDNTLRVIGDWLELWDEAAGACYYVHCKTGIRRKTAPPRTTSKRSALPKRPATPPVGAKGPRRMRSRSSGSPGSPFGRSGSPGTGAGGGAGAGAGARSGSSPILRPGPGPPGVSPLRLRSFRNKLPGFGAPPGSPMSPLASLDGSGSRPGSARSLSSALSAGSFRETPTQAFRKKRYRFLCGLRRRANGALSRPGTPTLGAGGVQYMVLQPQSVFQHSYAKLRVLEPEELLKKFRIQYEGQEGIDSGGLTKDWYLQVSREMFKPELCLFEKLGDRRLYTISTKAMIHDDYLDYFKFVGRFLGKAIYDVQLVDLPFCTALYRHLLGQPVGIPELEEMDETYAKSLEWITNNDITGIIHEDFAVTREELGVMKTYELKPGGADIEVTEANKHEYVRLQTEWRTYRSMKKPINAMLAGFNEIVPLDAIRVFSVDELELLLNGKPEVDVQELKSKCRYQGGLSRVSAVVSFFWKAMAEGLDEEGRHKVLRFATGTSRVPLDGYDPPFTLIAASDLSDTALPKAHTCFNQLVLPAFKTYDIALAKLKLAIEQCDSFLLG